MMRRLLVLVTVLALLASSGSAMVMNQNTDRLPEGCQQIAGWENITVHAGRAFAEQFNGKVFTYDDRSFSFDPCTKVSVTFINNDSVRHQFMVHGLPMELYPMGMFTIEVSGPGRDTGTLILPAEHETLLVHCGVAQHMQKGMKAQLKIADGDGNIANIPGITGAFEEHRYDTGPVDPMPIIVTFATSLILGLLLFALHHHRTRESDGETGS